MTEPRPAASQTQEAEGLDSLLRYLKAARGVRLRGLQARQPGTPNQEAARCGWRPDLSGLRGLPRGEPLGVQGPLRHHPHKGHRFLSGPPRVGLPGRRGLQDLEVSYRPVELRAALKQAHEKRRVIRLGRVKSHAGTDDERAFEVEITPLFAAGSSEALGASITFADVTAHSRLDAQHREVEREL